MNREEAISLLHDMKDTYDEIHENTNYEIGYEQMTALDMAIESLSAEAEKTYIGIDIPYGSDKGIATIFKRKDDKLILEEVKKLMRSWIPCSERLPEVGEICLLTVHEYGWNCKDYTRVIIGEYSDNYADHILAWMPLPDPYTEMEP